MRTNQRSRKQYLYSSLLGAFIALIASMLLIISETNTIFALVGWIGTAIAAVLLGLIVRRFITLRAEARHRTMFR